ncbi:hypothetical protein RCG17_01255 [Neobacillus sp. PS3-12]|uniref:hypothetical protein n=1 Tax=Neobacillus sp. PS3-12 TaxID=3070677 RepID=UPI0027E06063|nr:hypothetical protein [Neobacillus sp. PS3-12]WML53365.1 hypothetical protein RCG17_01255 [Neobacillus sp. PS3-12]
MSFNNSNDYEYCKKCYKQKQFCTCQEEVNPCDQTFCEHNPLSQSIGEQEQQQQQQQGGLEQEQGPQTQEQIQEGQRQGPQTQEQEQGPQTQGNQQQGPQSQAQTEVQNQTGGAQDQAQTENQNQAQGAQTQTQRHGDQNQQNNQSISTTVDVDGVTLNVKCGDCKPIIFPSFPFNFHKKQRNMNNCDGGCDDMGNCDCQENEEDKCPKDCNCCVRNLANLLNQVRQFQATTPITIPPNDLQQIAINIFFSVVTGLRNPTTGQVITDVVDCSVVTFRTAGQTTPVPNTTVQLCDVAGICATISTTPTPTPTPNIFQFLLQQANNETEDCSCNKKNKPCKCPCCARGIGEELSCAAKFGLKLNVLINGLPISTTPALPPLYVLKVKDCLAYFVNDLINPTEICVFSLCAIAGFTVVSQTLG